MLEPTRRSAAAQVRIQLIEADVDIGFGLVDEVRQYRLTGQREFSARALQDATNIVADIEQRLQQLDVADILPFLPLVDELRHQIAKVRREGF